jgi:hypothetical protein
LVHDSFSVSLKNFVLIDILTIPEGEKLKSLRLQLKKVFEHLDSLGFKSWVHSLDLFPRAHDAALMLNSDEISFDWD